MILFLFQTEAADGRFLRKIVDWTAFGFERVETAYSWKRAEELCEECRPDLVICSLTFEKGSYQDLLFSIRKRYPEVQFIITGKVQPTDMHALLRLAVIDFVENPTDSAAWNDPLRSFLEKSTERNTLLQKAEEGTYWKKNQRLIQDQFWKNLFLSRAGTDPEEIERAAAQVMERIDKDKQYLMVLITMKNQEEMWRRWGEHVCQSMIQNLGRAVTEESQLKSRVIIIYSRVVILLEETSDREITDCCKALIQRGKQELDADLFCYIGDPVYCERLAELYQSLLSYSKDDILRQKSIVKISKRLMNSSERVIIPPSWSDILYSMEPLRLVEEVRYFLVAQAKDGLLSEKRIRIFQQDMLQLLFSYMEKKELSAHELYDNSSIYELYKVAILSIDGMCWWIQHCINYINETVSGNNLEAGGKVTATVKEYIRTHLDEKISMEDLAAKVHLSPDYMSKIFKHETGETIRDYVIRKRMEAAKTLLRVSDKSISEIGLEVGYDNPSYFVRIFRQRYDTTPKQYREHQKSGKKI